MNPQHTRTATGTMQLSFHFVDAKVRGRRRKLYEGDDLAELTQMRSVRDLAETLYPSDTPEGYIDLQKRLVQDCVDEIARFLVYLNESRAALQRALLRRYQVRNLKIALRFLGRESAEEEADRHMVDLPDSISLPRQDLLAASDVREFIRLIPDESLQQSARDSLELYDETKRTGYVEMALDRGWWKLLTSAYDGLSWRDSRGCSAVLKAESLCLSLLCILRATWTYKLTWDTVAPLLPRGPGSSNEDMLREVFENPSPETVNDAVPRESTLKISPQDAQDVAGLENTLWNRMVDVANGQYYGSMGNMGTLLAYCYLKQAETRRLVSLTEMLRRQVPKEDMLSRLGIDKNN